ncbi:MAG: DUF1893 domain-containing protein [Clostridia bacterium]|nr:DUF1893 domain-containing protein [Clostridia bacterium]
MFNDINLDIASSKLSEGPYSCVIASRGRIVMSSEKRGVAPLVDYIMNFKSDSDSSLADKVIGKAAALLCVKAGFKNIFTRVVSTPAKDILGSYGIDCIYLEEVPFIKNRAGTGLCPMEHLSRGVDSPDEMYEKVLGWLKSEKLL